MDYQFIWDSYLHFCIVSREGRPTTLEGDDMKGLLTTLALFLGLTAASASDGTETWSRFRGPNGTGIAEGQKPPVEIGPEKNVKWKVPVPSGLSSPIVVGDKLVLTAFDGGKLYTIAYDRANGKESWRREAPAKEIEKFLKGEGSPAASTCASDGQRIVSYFGSCGLICYDLAGKELWRFELPVAVIPADFGSGTSPIITDGLVLLVHDVIKDPKIFALDARTGSLKWEKKRSSPVSYSSPVIWETPTGKQVVVAGHAQLVGYDLNSGEEKWSVAGTPSGCCTSPVTKDGVAYFAGWSPGGADDKEFQMPSFDEVLKMGDTDKDGMLSKEEAQKTFVKGFFDSNDRNKDGKISRDEWDETLKFMRDGKNNAFALKIEGSGDATKTHLLWQKTRGLPYIATAILYRGQYVMVKDGGMITAYDAKTGKEIYLQERVAGSGRYYASPVAANGNIYFTSLDDGTVTVIKGGSDKPEVVVKNPKLGERTAATPAIADNTLYIRTEGHLYAFAVPK